MSNPAKDHQIRKDKRKRKNNLDKYEPIVLWVKPKYNQETSKGMINIQRVIRREIRNDVDENMFGVDVLTSNEPNVTDIVTEFDEYDHVTEVDEEEI